MDIKQQLILAAACLDDIASGTLDAEAITQEKLAAPKHVENLHNLADLVPGLLEALRTIEAHLSTHADVNKGNSKVHFCYVLARNVVSKAGV